MDFEQTLLSTKLELLNQLLKNDEWEDVNNSNGVNTRRKFLPDSTYACFRSTGIIDRHLDELVEATWKTFDNLENNRQFDADIDQYQIVKNIDENTRLCYQVNKLPWPLWSRDMVYIQHRLEKNGVVYILMYSVDTDSVPRYDDKYVRSTINISAYTFEKSNIGTIINRFVHVEPAGNIPATLVNSYANKTRNLILHLLN